MKLSALKSTSILALNSVEEIIIIHQQTSLLSACWRISRVVWRKEKKRLSSLLLVWLED
ncbi:hypothetical protein Csa_015764 [Cucumis sativus]|uniref:Uncharacterized protein n=1 Tax=Cucumis sativus TaxID=3659 RepID=A0A0A0K368_CUCSA|nr:hypothetical protein Csa_015764 [Cucumis sativus]